MRSSLLCGVVDLAFILLGLLPLCAQNLLPAVADWPKADGVTVEKDDATSFLHFTQAKPGELVMLHRSVAIPEGTPALHLTFRARCHQIVPGEKPWFDGRLIVNFLDASLNGHPVPPSPETPHLQGSSPWKNYTQILLVPAGAKALEVMPCLFRAQSGTLDLSDLTLVPATEEEIAKAKAEALDKQPLPVPATEAPQPEKWPADLFVVGNRLQTKQGREIWLQGIVIPSLEWSATGENALASSQVAIEDWKANILRLEVRDDFWFGQHPNQSDGGAAYRALVEAEINLAANRGVYVVLDLHRYRAVKKEHLAFWKEVATRYKNHPAVLFELFNEPHDISWEVWQNGGRVEEKKGSSDEDAFLSEADKKKREKSFQSPGMQALVDVIRATGAKNLIVAGGNGWSYDLSGVAQGHALDDRGGHGTLYAWHVYNWHQEWEKNVLATAEKYPILITECGADVNKMGFIPADEQEAPATWSPKFIAFVQKHRLNWTAFSFHPRCTPVLITDWKFTPTPGWGALVKEALAGKEFEYRGTK